MFLGEKKNCLTISSRMEPHFSGDDTSIIARGLPGWIGGRGARGDLLPRYNVNIDIRGVGGGGCSPHPSIWEFGQTWAKFKTFLGTFVMNVYLKLAFLKIKHDLFLKFYKVLNLLGNDSIFSGKKVQPSPCTSMCPGTPTV